jgi:hypothetical protein
MLEKVVPWDLLVAFGLIALGLGAVLLYRMGFLPKKSLPFVAAAVTGVVGWQIFKRRRENALRAEIKRIEDRIAERTRELDALAVRAGTADEEVIAARAALEKEKAAVAKELLLLEERSAERRREIEAMDTNQVFEELRRL